MDFPAEVTATRISDDFDRSLEVTLQLTGPSIGASYGEITYKHRVARGAVPRVGDTAKITIEFS